MSARVGYPVDAELLSRARACHDGWAGFRRARARCKRFTYGDQWGDMVEENGVRMTEEEYILSQGNMPLKNNLIRRLVRNVLGVYRNRWAEPRCRANDADEGERAAVMQRLLRCNSRINRMEELEAMVEDGRMAVLPKKEQAVLGKELTKLQTNLGGARDMKGLPQALFVIDTKREENAIKEAQRLNIPVVALIDTNSDPDEVEYGIPCNDDAISAVTLMCELMADACLAGSGKEQVSEAEMAAEPKAE